MQRFAVTIFLAVSCFICFTSAAELDVFEQTATIESYLYATGLPALSAFSVCFRLYTEADDNRAEGYLFSLATAANDNEMKMQWAGLTLHIQDQELSPLSNLTSDLDLLFLGWHKHCLTWKVNGRLQWYADMNTEGVMELFSSVDAGSQSINSGGSLVLLQEQDAVLDSLSIQQIITAKITAFNMWDFELSEEQVKVMGCKDEGNVVSWDTLNQEGNATMATQEFACDDDPVIFVPTEEKMADQLIKQEAIFCQIEGADLGSSHRILSLTTKSATNCIKACAANSNCRSANYQRSTSVCQLNNDIDYYNRIDWTVDLGADFVHFTTRACHV